MDKYILMPMDSIDETPEKKSIEKNVPMSPVLSILSDPSKLPLLRIQTSSVFYIILVYLPM